MKETIITTIRFLTFLMVIKSFNADRLRLKQVVILGRHNVREALSQPYTRYTHNTWPKWITKPGNLTLKGALLEGYMGEYFSEWFRQEELFKGCPEEDEVFVYANSKNRTIETARDFVDSAFKGCDVPVYHKEPETFDPVFSAVIHDTSDAQRKKVINEIQKKLNEANLGGAYEMLNNILRLQNADICKDESICDLVKAKNEIVYEAGQEPQVAGALTIGNSIVDRFLASYYNGLPLKDIAWGQLNSPQKWIEVTEIDRQDKNVRFNTTAVAKDVAGPLLQYLSDIFRFNNTKFILLVGHDVNQVPVLNAMGFKGTTLPYQYDALPIGGKIVFQKWANASNEYLKVEYIYQSWQQIRNGVKLSLNNPPQRVLMELKSCQIDENGLCPWNEFIYSLNFL